eukprot:CAMPEP_0174731362 /NCGR_PEP_ID=MMETSP1094-20130205/57396_1 /TAXON_ID=156173 /ORGANISM="Chrysochromulina brevifilum, Strain UTEX LB 985" /LENGTH=60 /DNA_ID=CAMNT_0015933735 /DNA_START=284 /DNA_END=463 /DNA_ORIENTATION=-
MNVAVAPSQVAPVDSDADPCQEKPPVAHERHTKRSPALAVPSKTMVVCLPAVAVRVRCPE